MVTVGNPQSPTIVSTIKLNGAKFTSSYEEEFQAMEDAARWISSNGGDNSIYMIVTDSNFLSIAL